MEYKNLRLESDEELTYIVLNRPEKFNALSREMVREIALALDEIGGLPSVRVIVIRGEGKHFCTGHDLKEMTGRDMVEYRDIFQQCCRMMTRIHQTPQPVIAQVHGIATAAGCQLVAACDLAVAEEGALFSTPGVRIGLFCVTPMIPLTRAVGRKRALEMLLTGRNVTAHEAADWGLINRVTTRDELASTVKEMARAIADASPLTVEIGKQAFYAQVDLNETAAYDVAQNIMPVNLATQDAQEGINAFLEKRKPAWQGK